MPVKKDRVEEVPPLELIGERYEATDNVNVRGGPSTKYKKVGLVSDGEAVMVSGKVKSKDWFMISRDGAGSGFVHKDYFNLTDDVAGKQRSVDARDDQSADENIATVSVEAERKCRTVEQTVTLESGETQTDTVTACKGPNGWEVQG